MCFIHMIAHLVKIRRHQPVQRVPDHQELSARHQGRPPLRLSLGYGVLPECFILTGTKLLQPPLALREVGVEGGVQPEHVGGPGGGGHLQKIALKNLEIQFDI